MGRGVLLQTARGPAVWPVLVTWRRCIVNLDSTHPAYPNQASLLQFASTELTARYPKTVPIGKFHGPTFASERGAGYSSGKH
jgi:hypothetical protein